MKKNQSGKVELFLLISIALLWCYFTFGRSTLLAFLTTQPRLEISKNIVMSFSPKLFPAINLTAIAILSISFLFSLGATVHMLMTGTSPAALKKKTLRKVVELDKISDECLMKLRNFEDRVVSSHLFSGTGRVGTNISLSTDIISALKNRIDEIYALINSNRSVNHVLAADLLSQPLDFRNNCLDTLLYAERTVELPTLFPADCGEILDDLFLAIDLEVTKAETVLQQKRKGMEEHKKAKAAEEMQAGQMTLTAFALKAIKKRPREKQVE